MIPSIGYEPSTSSSSSSEEEDSDDEYREEETRNIENLDSEDEVKEEGIEPSDVKKKKGKTKVGQHECPYCEKKFQFPNKLREHVRVHDSNRFQCYECKSPRKFDTRNQLRAHQKLLHSHASHECPQCSYTSPRLADIRRHFDQNHVDGVPCTVVGCGIRVAKNRLKTHIKEVHGPAIDAPPKPIRAKLSFNACPKCDYRPDESIFDAEEQHRDLMRHIEIVHEKKDRSICPFGCGATILAEEIQNHWTTCTKFNSDEPSSLTPRLVDDSCRDTNTVTSQSVSSEGYPDDTDSVTVPTSSQGISASLNDIDLDEQDEESVREPPKKKRKSGSRRRGEFNCHVCEKTFTMLDNLRKHIRAFHSENSKKEVKKKKNQFKCDRKLTNEGEEVCGKTFRTEQALLDHFNVHDNHKPYACLTCNQRFHARDRFAVHLSKYHLTSIKDLNANDSQFREKSKTPETLTPSISQT